VQRPGCGNREQADLEVKFVGRLTNYKEKRMTRILIRRAPAIMVAALLVTGAGCSANRGTFGPDSCDAAKRIAVPNGTVLAVYFDKNGAIVGTDAEDLTDTQNKKMCPAAEAPPDRPGACPAGYCAITVPQLGKTYCKPLPC
jgi:hypothetical protein